VKPSPDDPAELAARLRPSLLRLQRVLRLQRSSESLTLTQLSALGTVGRLGPLSAGDLAAAERVQPPSMTKVIAALEDAGLVVREPHPGDKRQAIIAITAPGLRLLDGVRRSGDVWLAGQLAKLTAAERTLLGQVAPVFDKLADLGWPADPCG
jgi:DNA-binding MarR family transcriptional regulator